MTEQQQQGPPEIEIIPVSRSERVAGVIGVLVAVGLVLICFDLATGGRLSGKIGGAPAGPCQGCGGDDADG